MYVCTKCLHTNTYWSSIRCYQCSAFLTYPWCGTLINYFTLQYFNGKENIHFVLTVVHASLNDKRQNIDFFDKAL